MKLNHGCRGFRAQLARAIEGLPVPDQLSSLAWHEHLLGCTPCREFLEREEALEVLLATLPTPNLPPDLKRRLVARLSSLNSSEAASESQGLDALLDVAGAPVPEGLGARVRSALKSELALDALLDLDQQVPIPAGLGARVTAGLRREAALDALLELDEGATAPAGLSARVASGLRSELALDQLLDADKGVEVPAGLAQDVLRSLRVHRQPRVPRLRLLRSMPKYAAAAGLLLTVLGISLWNNSEEGTSLPTVSDTEEIAALRDPLPLVLENEPDPSLLAVMDIIDNDGLWTDTEEGAEVRQEDSDLHMQLSDSLEPGDELLLTFLDDEESETEDTSGG